MRSRIEGEQLLPNMFLSLKRHFVYWKRIRSLHARISTSEVDIILQLNQGEEK